MANYKCLIVEDSPMMRQLLVHALTRIEGFAVVEAEDGLDGLKELSIERFDIIIIDINLPVMDGLKLIKHIRSDDELHCLVPIIVVSTEGDKEDQQQAFLLGANVYLTKPVNATEIIFEVKRLLNIED